MMGYLLFKLQTKECYRFTFIVSPWIFVHSVFHQLMHSYILLKYYHMQLL